jgi:hypothetical protein
MLLSVFLRESGSSDGKTFCEIAERRGNAANLLNASAASASVYGLMLSNSDKSTIVI